MFSLEEGSSKIMFTRETASIQNLHGNNGLHRAHDQMCREFSIPFNTPSPSTCKIVLCTLTLVENICGHRETMLMTSA